MPEQGFFGLVCLLSLSGGSTLLAGVLSPAQLSWLKGCKMAAASSSLGTSNCGKCQESQMD